MADDKTGESAEISHQNNSKPESKTSEDGARTSRSPPVLPKSAEEQDDVPISAYGPAEDSQSESESPSSTSEDVLVDSEVSRSHPHSPATSDSSDTSDSSSPHDPVCPLQPPSNIVPNQVLALLQGGNIVPQHAEEPEIDGESTGPHSDYSDDSVSTTDTITSTNYKYHYENGRRYHAFVNDIPYLLPNDEKEQERLNKQHKMWVMALGGKLHLAPLPDSIHEVLDVGTGTGIWAINFADSHPSAEVTGTDLSPIQPHLVPPNCKFVIDNSEDEWEWRNKFDFIHSRALASSWRDWTGYFRKCYQALKPGGYLELHEYAFPFETDIPTPTVPTPSYLPSTTPPPNPVLEWTHHFATACRMGGVGIDLIPHLDTLLRDAGFTSVTKKLVRQPINGWSEDPEERERGQVYADCFDFGLGISLFTRRLGWSYAKAEVFLVDVRKAARDEGMRVWVPLWFYTGRKAG